MGDTGNIVTTEQEYYNHKSHQNLKMHTVRAGAIAQCVKLTQKACYFHQSTSSSLATYFQSNFLLMFLGGTS